MDKRECPSSPFIYWQLLVYKTFGIRLLITRWIGPESVTFLSNDFDKVVVYHDQRGILDKF